MWISKEFAQSLLEAQKSTNDSIKLQTRSIESLAAILSKQNEAIARLLRETEAINRQLIQYAKASSDMIAATIDLVSFKNVLELRIAALQFSANQLTKLADKKENSLQYGEQLNKVLAAFGEMNTRIDSLVAKFGILVGKNL